MAKRYPKKKPVPQARRKAEKYFFFWGALLALAVILAYLPVWHAGYIWDDEKVVTNNPVMADLLGLEYIWTSGEADICPLTLTTFWGEHRLWGVAPLPYHLVTLLFHAACAVALWRVLGALKIPGAWLGAALWALHPVQVESVAWVSEMKNTESGLFYLLTILYFIRGLSRPLGRDYALCLLFSVLAMTAKSSTVILPLILLICAWWVDGRGWKWSWLWRTLPLYALALLAIWVSIWTQALRGSSNEYWSRTLAERIAGAGYAIWFYLGKLIWPHPLLTIYPRWKIDGTVWTSFLPLAAALALPLLLWCLRRPWARASALTWKYFCIALLPALGLANLAFSVNSLVADHFQYLASMGPLALAGAGLTQVGRPLSRPLATGLAAALLVLLGLWSFRQAGYYQSEESLWSHTLAFNPNSWAAHNNWGAVLYKKGKSDAAFAEDEKGIALNPRDEEAYNNMAIIHAERDQYDAAIADFEKSIQVNPTYPEAWKNLASAHNNYGLALLQKGRIDDAIAQDQLAVQIDPKMAMAYNNLGTALLQKKRLDDAALNFQKAIALDPDNANAHFGLGLADALRNQAEPAIAEFQIALRLEPDLAVARENIRNLQAYLEKKKNNIPVHPPRYEAPPPPH